MDRVSAKTRSQIMARVKSVNTGLEGRFAAILAEAGIGTYARNPSDLPGRPDFVFADQRLVVFVDSCFWHGCRRHLRRPKSHSAYWMQKIAKNKERDRRQTRELRKTGWRVLRVWEHELRRPTSVVIKMRRALAA